MATISIQQQIEQVKRDLSAVAQKQVPYAIRLTVNKLAENAKKNFEMKELPRIDRPTRYAANMMRVRYAGKGDLTSELLVKTKGLETKRGGVPPDEVLKHLFEGGLRRGKGFEGLLIKAGLMPKGYFAVPGEGVTLDAHGNFPRGLLIQLLSYFRAFQTSGSNMTEFGRKKFEEKATRKQFKGAQFSRFFIIPVGDPSRLHPGIWARVGFLVPGIRKKAVIARSIKPLLMFVSANNYKRLFNLPEIVDRVVARDLSFEFNKAMEHSIRTAK